MITHLVFAGALVRNAAYAGALQALEEGGYLHAARGFSGVSSGSIVASLCAVGFTPSEVHSAILDLDFRKILDGGWLLGPFRFLFQYGWHKGDYLESNLDALLARKLGRSAATVAQVRQATGKDLRIVGADLCTGEPTIFSSDTTADVPIAQAVRISMSIPLVFAARPFGNHAQADGGLVWNFPINIFDGETSEVDLTLGFRVVSKARESRVASLRGFVHALFSSVLRAQEVLLERTPKDLARTIDLPDLGISGTDFNISNKDKERLAQAAKAAALARLPEVLRR